MTDSYTLGRANEANVLGAMVTGLGDLVLVAVQRGAGLDLTQTTALLVVAKRPGQSVSELAVALSLTHSGAVRVVDRLQTAGLLSRQEGVDGRSVGLAVTAAGLPAVDAALAERHRALDSLLESLAPAVRAGLVQGARALAAALPTDGRGAHRICRLCEHDVCRGPACPVGSAVTANEALVADGVR